MITSLAMGLMAKSMLVSVPFLCLVLDAWPLRRWDLRGWPPRRIVVEKLPLLGLVVASCVVTFVTQQAGDSVAASHVITWSWRLVNTPVAYVTYLFKTVWPTDLTCFYPHPAVIATERLGDWIFSAISAVLFLMMATVFVLLRARRWPYLVVGWLWFLGMLVPVIGLVQVGDQAWADRYAYLPLVGVYVMFSWSLAELVQRRPALRQAVIGLAAVVLLVLLPLTRSQVAVWHDSQSLYEHAVAVTKNNYVAHNNLALELMEAARVEEAMGHYNEALRIKPDYANAHNNLGNALNQSGHAPEAVAHYNEALRIEPDHVAAHNNIAWLSATCLEDRVRDGPRALLHARIAARLSGEGNESASILDTLAAANAAAGDFQEAVRCQEKALRVAPDPQKVELRERLELYKSGRPYREPLKKQSR